METLEVKPIEWITIKSKLPKPFVPISERQPILSERLIMRPMQEDDLEEYHQMRTQPEVMKWTGQGCSDVDIEATKENMKLHLPPKGDLSHNYVIRVRETNALVGLAGIRSIVGELGWPEIGYILRQEHWGQGYATEILTSFVKFWWSLPREETEVEVKVDKRTVTEEPGSIVRERVTAITDAKNAPSQKVLAKLGFTFATAYADESSGIHRGTTIRGFVLELP